MANYQRKNSNNILVRFFFKLLLILIIIVIPALFFINFFSIKNIEVVGVQQYSEDQIKDLLLKERMDRNSAYLYFKYQFLEQPKLPFVEKIKVKMNDNHSVTIFVYEKMVAGCVEFMGEYLYFDKDGIVVESSSEKLTGIPLIKGLQYTQIVLSKKLIVQKEELFDIIIDLTQLIELYDLNVDSIRFQNDYEVTMESGDNTVLLGKRNTYDEPLAELKNILKESEGKSLTIDMRNYDKEKDYIIAKPK
ncbi:MAG: cell division protein FtsQ/DivIB [Mobilitalea sp.]